MTIASISNDLNLSRFYVRSIEKEIEFMLECSDLRIPEDAIIIINHISNTEYDLQCQGIDAELYLSIAVLVFAF
jgi:hypothetical protein